MKSSTAVLRQHFGEQELFFVVPQVDHRLVRLAKQFFAGELVLVVLDPVHDVEIVLLSQ